MRLISARSRRVPPVRWLLALLLCVLCAAPAAAQPRPFFDDCAHRTGTDATVLLPASAALRLGGAALEAGDEIAVFTPGGQCAGRGVWRGATLAITIWGDDAMTRAVDGLRVRDSLRFRLWDASEQIEYRTDNARFDLALRTGRPHTRTRLRFVPNGLYIFNRFAVAPIRQADRQP